MQSLSDDEKALYKMGLTSPDAKDYRLQNILIYRVEQFKIILSQTQLIRYLVSVLSVVKLTQLLKQ